LSAIQDLEKSETLGTCIELNMRLIEVSPVQVKVGAWSMLVTQG
jgi:hypothetical protein